MNRMDTIAQLLNLDIDEEFELEGSYTGTTFRITLKGLEYKRDETNWQIDRNGFLVDLLTGVQTIKKLPWRPKNWDTYYVPAYDDSKNKYTTFIWMSNEANQQTYENGMVCKTKEEAENLCDQIVQYTKKLKNIPIDTYRNILMYGVKESDLTPGSKTFQEIAGDRSFYSISTDVTDDLTDVDYKKNVQLFMIIGKKDSYLGYTACFPWDITKTMDTMLFPSDVKDAIIDILKPYGYDEAEIIRFCDEINDIDAF